jgi:DNA-binding NarL/FixJ family response regulator
MAGKVKQMSTIKQLIRLYISGLSNRKIGRQLNLYKGTVNAYVQKILTDILTHLAAFQQ